MLSLCFLILILRNHRLLFLVNFVIHISSGLGFFGLVTLILGVIAIVFFMEVSIMLSKRFMPFLGHTLVVASITAGTFEGRGGFVLALGIVLLLCKTLA